MGLKKYMREFFIDLEDLKKIWVAFLAMDYKNRGFINLNHLINYMSEKSYSVVAPFVERFFELIDKAASDNCTFEEFFPALCTFVLLKKQEIIAFIFTMLDRNNDKVVSKIDLLAYS